MPPTQFANVANNVVSALNAAIIATDTTIALTPGSGVNFPVAPFYVSCEYEVMYCNSKTGDNLQVSRGQDGTAATSHIINSVVELRNNAGLWKDAYNAINTNSTAVDNLTANILNKTALPPDTTFQDNIQSFSHKTIDLTDVSKQNIIIGNVSPDPSQLVYQNILNNGGFEEWYFSSSTTLAAGTPTSGVKSSPFSGNWNCQTTNDSSITCAKDTANTDPGNPSGVDCLINVTTVQANDTSSIWQQLLPGVDVNPGDLNKLVNAPLSVSTRIKSISGNLQVQFTLASEDTATSTWTNRISSWMPLTNAYATYKFENQIPIPTLNPSVFQLQLSFKGVGQIAIDNVMLIVGSVSTSYRPKPPQIATGNNILTNPGFEVWQRAGTFTNPNNVLTADRWSALTGSGSSLTINQTNAPGPGGGRYSMNVIYTHAAQSTIWQTVKDIFPYAYASRVVTFSIWISLNSGAAANAIIMRLYDGTNVTYSPVAVADSSWHQYTVSLNVTYGATYVECDIILGGSCTAYFDNATLIAGYVPLQYTQAHADDDMARCLRYYEILITKPFNSYGTAGQQYAMPFYYKAMKAVAPTITKVGAWSITNAGSVVVNYNHVDGYSLMWVPTAAGLVSISPALNTDVVTAEANP